MKRIEKCLNEDCIPTHSSCVTWNGGDISFLGLCDGDQLNPLMEEIVNELKKLVGENFSKFDISSLLTICKKKEPDNTTLLSILTLLKENQICLKSYTDTLYSQMLTLFEGQNVKINLKCYSGLNGLGLSITREQLDQLIINILCNHKNQLDSADSTILRLQEEINEAERNRTIEEVKVATCINSSSLPLSTQIQNTSKELCDYLLATGTSADIALALSKTPTDLNGEFGGISGWNPSPILWSEYYSNTLLEVENLRARLQNIKNNCCSSTCEDVIIAFTASLTSDEAAILINFSRASGIVIPVGFEDCGSEGTITDTEGNTQSFDIAIEAGTSVEIPIEGLIAGDLYVNISSKFCNADKGLTCHKCTDRKVTAVGCVSPVCKVCVIGEGGSYVELTYKYGGSYTTVIIPQAQCNYIPTGATLVSIDRINGAIEDSDCLDLSTVEEKVCYQMQWASNEDTTPSDVLEHQDSNIDYIEVGGIQYPINQQPNMENDADGSLESVVRAAVPQYLMKLVRIDASSTGNRFEDIMYFKATPSIASTIVMKITGVGFGNGLYLKPVECTDCC